MRILSDRQRRSPSRRIRTIPEKEVITLPLNRSTLCPNLQRSIDVKFVKCVREYDRSDISSFHHQVVPGQEFPKMSHQKFPNFDNRRNCGYGSIDWLIPQVRLRVLTVDRENQFPVLQLKFENRLSDLTNHRISVLGANPMFSREPGDPSIERAAVNVRKTKPPGELTRHRAFS